MIPYFTLMLPPAVLAVLRLDRNFRTFFLLAFCAYLLVFIGYRWNIGFDWNNYLYKVKVARTQDFSGVLEESEILSNAAIWLASRTELGIVTLNLIAGFVMCAGLFLFARATENPWMTMVVTIPYYVIVVMSATRQAMAIFIIFALYAYWKRISLVTKMGVIFVASLCHTSAFVCMIFVLPDVWRLPMLQRIVMLSAFAVISAYYVFWRPSNVEQFEYYNQTYIEYADVLNSPGALAHVLMIVIPSALYILFFRMWRAARSDDRLVLYNCIVSIAIFPGVFFYSTAFDRLSLYFSAGALVALSSMPRVMTGNLISRKLSEAAMVMLHLAILYVWLRYANSAIAWVPYRNLVL